MQASIGHSSVAPSKKAVNNDTSDSSSVSRSTGSYHSHIHDHFDSTANFKPLKRTGGWSRNRERMRLIIGSLGSGDP
ncbi:conserved hypothetical protein [Ricinus communis]|uniref:Uncharacterized protein n=1 Tax=Ricinus communis TaxID=3988 RepID=B9T0J5_RICCO|nr:conserved hypothetical protein [Ricinus communis]